MGGYHRPAQSAVVAVISPASRTPDMKLRQPDTGGSVRWLLLWLLAALVNAPAAPAAEPIPLRAGPLSMVFEPDNAFLRYVKLGSDEVLRGISAPIRNQSWGTVRPEVSQIQLDNQGDRFSLKFEVVCRERD